MTPERGSRIQEIEAGQVLHMLATDAGASSSRRAEVLRLAWA